MQRTLVLISILVLVSASLAIGALAAHWPFWMRAMAWHSATDGWPQDLRGPWQPVRAGQFPPLPVAGDEAIASLAHATGAEVLMVADGPRVRAWFAPGFSAQTPVDGRALTQALPALLLGMLQAQGRPDLLDTGVGAFIEEWKEDPRGAITARQLLWQLSGLEGGRPWPFNPFDAQAGLQSGPDFRRAALSVAMKYPPGSHFEPAPANAQVLALVASEISGMSWAQLLESRLWSRLAATPASGLLDHRRGAMASHCCFRAASQDWLRIAMLLSNEGVLGHEQILETAFVRELAKESPVNPGYGLGFRLRDARQLILESEGRLLIATMGSGKALFWSGRSALEADARNRLFEALDR